jgi:hypothetical protein
MKNWGDETIMSQGGSVDISRMGAGVKGKVMQTNSRKAKIEAELKLLEWHKLANDAALKAALLQTKNLKQDSPGRSSSSYVSDDAQWIRKVIDDEQVKPLEVYIHIQMYIHIYIYICIYLSIYIHIFIYIYTCVYM